MAILVTAKPKGTTPTGFSLIRVSADTAGGIAYIPMSGMYAAGIQNKMTFHAIGSSVIKYAMTLADEVLATNPDATVQAGVPWTPDVTLTNGEMTREPDKFLATALRVDISGAGELYIAII